MKIKNLETIKISDIPYTIKLEKNESNCLYCEIKFLLYSNLRSSQIIFEELMQKIDENIDCIINYID